MIRPVSKVLLLDMDGVVLHQPNLHRFVARRVCTFVRRSLDPKMPGLSFSQAEGINKVLYTTYGHTLTGLNSVFRLDKTIDDFNSYVYDSTAMSYISNLLDDSDMNTRASEARQLLETCSAKGTPVYVFSNAPIKWSNMVAETLGLPIDKDKILGSDHPVFEKSGHLKPYMALYADVDRLLNHRYSKNQEVLFVDDSMQNLVPCARMERWTPVLLLPGIQSSSTGIIKMCSNLLDVAGLV